MKLVLQRVSHASIAIDGGEQKHCGAGLVVLAGISPDDDAAVCAYMADKAARLRIFEDEAARMNLSLLDTAGALLLVPNFTLYADCKKGRRPSFIGAGAPAHAEMLFGVLAAEFEKLGIALTCGKFGSDMQVEIHNDGPVTILLDSTEIMPKRGA